VDRIRFWRHTWGHPRDVTAYVAFEAIVNASSLDWWLHQAGGAGAGDDDGEWAALPDALVGPDDRALWTPGPTPRRVPVLQRVIAGTPIGHATVVLAGDATTVTWSFVQDHRDRPVAAGPFTFARAAYEEALATYEDTVAL